MKRFITLTTMLVCLLSFTSFGQQCEVSNLSASFGALVSVPSDSLMGDPLMDSTMESRSVSVQFDVSQVDYLGRVRIEIAVENGAHSQILLYRSKSDLELSGALLNGHVSIEVGSLITGQSYNVMVSAENFAGAMSPVITGQL